jgi:hypothetical protein
LGERQSIQTQNNPKMITIIFKCALYLNSYYERMMKLHANILPVTYFLPYC